MKNLDYTLIVSSVPSEHQKRISNLLSALRDNIAVQGFGTVYKSEYSPEPTLYQPAEVWIVEYLCDATHVWRRSGNIDTRGEFSSREKARAAITKNYEKTGSRQPYRAHLVGLPETAEEWIVEVEIGCVHLFWTPSENRYTRGIFNSQAEAEEAIVKNEQCGDKVGMNYRVVRTKPTRLVIEPKPAEEWIVELSMLGGWARSGNLMTKGIFASEEAAEKAIIKKLDKHRNSLKASDYRTRRVTSKPEPKSEK